MNAPVTVLAVLVVLTSVGTAPVAAQEDPVLTPPEITNTPVEDDPPEQPTTSSTTERVTSQPASQPAGSSTSSPTTEANNSSGGGFLDKAGDAANGAADAAVDTYNKYFGPSPPEKTYEPVNRQLSDEMLVKSVTWVEDEGAIIEIEAATAGRVGVVDLNERSDEGRWNIQVLPVHSGTGTYDVNLQSNDGDLRMSMQHAGELSGITEANPTKAFMDSFSLFISSLAALGGGVFSLAGAGVVAYDRQKRLDDGWSLNV